MVLGECTENNTETKHNSLFANRPLGHTFSQKMLAGVILLVRLIFIIIIYSETRLTG